MLFVNFCASRYLLLVTKKLAGETCLFSVKVVDALDAILREKKLFPVSPSECPG